jgi:pimeloyl-ACP methyl ester carboxylesterase
MWVLFNGATVNRYTMWSWFWHDDEQWTDTAYLFLKDDDIRWYLGTYDNPKTPLYCDLISYIMNSYNLAPKDLCFIGHSMGGYAALYYGLKLGVGAVYAFRPQVTWDAAVLFYSIKKLKDVWIDLDVFAQHVTSVPAVYLQYGEFEPDTLAGHTLVDSLQTRYTRFIVEHTDHKEHIGYYPTKEHIEATITYLLEAP